MILSFRPADDIMEGISGDRIEVTTDDMVVQNFIIIIIIAVFQCLFTDLAHFFDCLQNLNSKNKNNSIYYYYLKTAL